ncbi:MAG: hypothetical protein MK179_12130 [Pirellulaceae bacterium]|nr:hypothetical protein [Pirellulaceae bacterium]
MAILANDSIYLPVFRLSAVYQRIFFWRRRCIPLYDFGALPRRPKLARFVFVRAGRLPDVKLGRLVEA